MSLSLLVLGGTRFVGRAIIEAALARNWEVAAFSRGFSGTPDPRVTHLVGDRLDPSSLAPLRSRAWDLVVDTWSDAPVAVRDSVRALVGHAARYAYISTESVYAAPPPLDLTESAPTVDAWRAPDEDDYAVNKRGAEIAVIDSFGNRALLARPGTILGPYEDVGRLTWWLSRVARGGEVLAPGPPDMRVQYVDARDLARFVLDAAVSEESGPFNVVCRVGHATMRSLLEACLASAGGPDVRLTWVDPSFVIDVGIEPWTELPIWLPPDHEYQGLHNANVERAYAAGLRCRPVAATVADTWAWMSGLDGPPPLSDDVTAPGLDPAREREVLAAWHAVDRV